LGFAGSEPLTEPFPAPVPFGWKIPGRIPGSNEYAGRNAGASDRSVDRPLEPVSCGRRYVSRRLGRTRLACVRVVLCLSERLTSAKCQNDRSNRARADDTATVAARCHRSNHCQLLLNLTLGRQGWCRAEIHKVHAEPAPPIEVRFNLETDGVPAAYHCLLARRHSDPANAGKPREIVSPHWPPGCS